MRKLKILHKYGDISNCLTNTKFNANITVTDIYFCGLTGPKLGVYYKYINIYVDRTCWYKIYWLSGSAPAVSSLLGNWHHNPIHPLFLLYTPLQIQIKLQIIQMKIQIQIHWALLWTDTVTLFILCSCYTHHYKYKLNYK